MPELAHPIELCFTDDIRTSILSLRSDSPCGQDNEAYGGEE